MTQTFSARTGALLIIIAGGLWGTIGVITQWLSAEGLTAISTAFWRFSIAAVFLMAYSTYKTGWQHLMALPRRDWLMVAANGFFLATSQTVYMAAIPLAGVTISTLITICAAPLVVVAFGLFTGGQRPHRVILIALAAALVGTGLLLADSDRSSGATNLPIGTLFSFIAAVTYAGVVLCGHRLTKNRDSLHINTLSFTIGAVMLGGVGLFTGLQTPQSAGGWVLAVYMGVFPSVIAYGIFLVGMRVISAEVASILTLTEPLAAAIFAALIFGESLTLNGWVGAILMCAGFVLTLRQPEKSL